MPSKEVQLAPEAVQVANCYISNNMDLEKTALDMELPVHIVSAQLEKKEVKQYTSAVLMNTGYNNRHKLHSTLDTIIDKKLEEMEDLEMGSSKDIIEILALKAKLRQDEMKLEIELEKVKQSGATTNVQINNNYSNLMEKILNA